MNFVIMKVSFRTMGRTEVILKTCIHNRSCWTHRDRYCAVFRERTSGPDNRCNPSTPLTGTMIHHSVITGPIVQQRRHRLGRARKAALRNRDALRREPSPYASFRTYICRSPKLTFRRSSSRTCSSSASSCLSRSGFSIASTPRSGLIMCLLLSLLVSARVYILSHRQAE